MERVNWNQAVRPSTHDLIAAINSGADDIDRIDGALDDIETDLDGKAGVSGTYPDFVAGEALSIRSGIRSSTFLTHALDSDVADGIAEVSRVLGNTVVWNQLGRFIKFAEAGGAYAVNRFGNALNAWTISDDRRTASITADVATSGIANVSYYIGNRSNHLLLISFIYRCTVAQSYGYVLNAGGQLQGGTVLSANVDVPIKTIIRMKGTDQGSSYDDIFFYPAGTAHNGAVGDYMLKDWQVFDLTAFYGAGNEPQTVAEFEAQYGSDYKPYSAPTLLSSTIAGIEGASSCEFPTQTLRGVYGYSDVMTKDGVETAIAETTVNITRISENTNVDYAIMRKPANSAGYGKWNSGRVLVPGYTSKSNAGVDMGAASNVGFIYDGAGIYEIFIGVKKGTTLAQAQEMLNGLPMYYELATHVFTQFAEPLDLTYRVEADGSESWIVPDDTQSAAVTGEIAYPLDPARALITHESFADFIDKLGAYVGATITETWDGSKYTYAFASGRSALLGSIETEPDALEVTEKDDMVKEIIEDERKEQ